MRFLAFDKNGFDQMLFPMPSGSELQHLCLHTVPEAVSATLSRPSKVHLQFVFTLTEQMKKHIDKTESFQRQKQVRKISQT